MMAAPNKGHTPAPAITVPPGGGADADRKAIAKGSRTARRSKGKVGPAEVTGAFTCALRDAVLRLERHEAVVRADRDPEGVHQQRVAARRLRTQLKVFAPLVDARWAARLRRELAWLDGHLAAVRDVDVVAERLRHQPNPATAVVLTAISERRRAVVADLVAVLDSSRYRRLRRSLDKAATAPRWRGGAPASRRAASDRLSRVVARRWKRLERSVRRWEKTEDDAALHRVRIDARRGRYVCDATASVLDPAVAGMARRLADLQDVLGEAHDALVTAAWAEDVGAGAEASVGEGIQAIAAAERAAAMAALRHWPAAWRRAAAVAAAKPWKRG